MRTIACVAGILGGVCWLVRLFVDDGAGDGLWYAGVVLLAVATLIAGLRLVPRSPVWLQAIVAVGSLGLAGSVLATIRAEGDAEIVDAVAGAVALVVSAVMFVRGRDRGGRERQPRHHGTHMR